MFLSVCIYLGDAVIAANWTSYALKEKNILHQYIHIFLICSFLAIIAAFRGFSGTDSKQYIRIFENPFITSTEIGYRYLMSVIRGLNLSSDFLFFIMGFFTVLFGILLIKNCQMHIDVKVSMYVFVLLLYYLSFNIMRQGLAVAISLYAMSLYMDRKKVISILLLILASTIHLPALICFAVVLADLLYTVRHYGWIMVSSFLILLFLVFNIDVILKLIMFFRDIPFLQIFTGYKYLKYFLSQETYDRHRLLVMLLRCIPVITICTMALYNFSKDIKLRIFYILMILGYIISMLGAITGTQIERMGYYFYLYNIIILGVSAKNSLKIGKVILGKGIAKFMVYSFITVLFLYVRVYRNYADLIPYGQGRFNL